MSHISLQKVLSNLRYILLAFEMCMLYQDHVCATTYSIITTFQQIERIEEFVKRLCYKTIYIRWLHNSLVYPGLHPHSHCPFRLLQGESFRQLLLQLCTQLLPGVPSLHTRTQISGGRGFIQNIKMTCYFLYSK